MDPGEKSTIDKATRWERPPTDKRAFSLVELLTVIFIISLLIAILIPSISKARNQAKVVTTKKEINSITAGLEMFKNDNGAEFPHTNGYPPSFSHPPIRGFTNFQPELGQFPFLSDSAPVVYGAHWLPAMLMGVDVQGFIPRRSVPRDIRDEPWRWYTPDANGTGRPITERATLYVDPGNLPMRKTRELPGRPNMDLFPDWSEDDNDPKAMQNLPVIVDAFDQAIIYYAANTHGRSTNMVEDKHLVNNTYSGSAPQTEGPPYYFHEDNAGFTGVGYKETESQRGWNYGADTVGHPIGESGKDYTAVEIAADTRRESFSTYVIDRKVYSSFFLGETPDPNTPLLPVNKESFLLISPGVDGRYGTIDDVSNLPRWPD